MRVTWTPGLGLFPDNHNLQPFAKPMETTVYTLTVRDTLGCTEVSSMTLQIDKERRVFIPSAFTPNDDNRNDIFQVYGGTGVAVVKTMMVFDRWGELLYEAHNFAPAPQDQTTGWDGNYGGQQLNSGTYVYYIEVVFEDGVTISYKGDINLIR
jgi:gliding motility-associated-like protein